MNKWVVLILLALAFLAGSLSTMSARNKAQAPTANPATVATGQASPEPLPETAATPLAMGRPGRAGGKPREPHFGKPGSKAAAKQDAAPTGHIEGEIQAIIFSSAADGDALTRFPATTKNIYMTLTPSDFPEEIELVASLRSALKEDEPFSEPVQSSGPPRKRTFRFSPPKGGWVSGPYQVVLKPAGSEQVVTMSRFEVEKASAKPPVAFAPPDYLNLVKDDDAEAPSSVFDQSDPHVLLRVASYKLPSNVSVRTVWSAVVVEQLTTGELVAVSEMSAPGPTADSVFSYEPPKGGFLPGSYRVDVYFDQQKVGSQAFFIQPTAAAAASASPTP